MIKSKKFRNIAANQNLLNHIKNAINYNVDNNKPINITFLQGCYKLWRLEEAPEVDWAEFFAIIHYIQWIKKILFIYKPGVVIDFYVDDLIMMKISNYKREEIAAYYSSFQKVINYILPYCPSNLNLKITTVSSQFNGEIDFWQQLDKQISFWKETKEINLSESMIKTIQLNYRPLSCEKLSIEQMKEIILIHDAHSSLSQRLRYRKEEGKILAMPQHYKGVDDRVYVGSTRDSIIKYWVGVGAIKVIKDKIYPTVLSPQQIKDTNFEIKNVKIEALNLKNFSKIRVFQLD